MDKEKIIKELTKIYKDNIRNQKTIWHVLASKVADWHITEIEKASEQGWAGGFKQGFEMAYPTKEQE